MSETPCGCEKRAFMGGGAGMMGAGMSGGGGLQTRLPAKPNPAAGVNMQASAGPGVGGAATADNVMSQLPAAQQQAGMDPQAGGGDPSAVSPDQSGPGGVMNNQPDPSQQGPQPGQQPGQQQAMPQSPGWMPNPQGQMLYPQGQGPITSQVPPMTASASADCHCGGPCHCHPLDAFPFAKIAMEACAEMVGSTDQSKHVVWQPFNSQGEEVWRELARKGLHTSTRPELSESTPASSKIAAEHPFAYDFATRCLAAGMNPREIIKAAAKYSKVSVKLAQSLKPILEKSAAGTGFFHGLGMPSMGEMGHFYGQAPGSMARIANKTLGGATGGAAAGSIIPGMGTAAGGGMGATGGLGKGLWDEMSRGTEAPQMSAGGMARDFGSNAASGAMTAGAGAVAGKIAPYAGRAARMIPGVGTAMDAVGSGAEALGGMAQRGMQRIPGLGGMMGGAAEGAEPGIASGVTQGLGGAGKSQAQSAIKQQAIGAVRPGSNAGLQMMPRVSQEANFSQDVMSGKGPSSQFGAAASGNVPRGANLSTDVMPNQPVAGYPTAKPQPQMFPDYQRNFAPETTKPPYAGPGRPDMGAPSHPFTPMSGSPPPAPGAAPTPNAGPSMGQQIGGGLLHHGQGALSGTVGGAIASPDAQQRPGYMLGGAAAGSVFPDSANRGLTGYSLGLGGDKLVDGAAGAMGVHGVDSHVLRDAGAATGMASGFPGMGTMAGKIPGVGGGLQKGLEFGGELTNPANLMRPFGGSPGAASMAGRIGTGLGFTGAMVGLHDSDKAMAQGVSPAPPQSTPAAPQDPSAAPQAPPTDPHSSPAPPQDAATQGFSPAPPQSTPAASQGDATRTGMANPAPGASGQPQPPQSMMQHVHDAWNTVMHPDAIKSMVDGLNKMPPEQAGQKLGQAWNQLTPQVQAEAKKVMGQGSAGDMLSNLMNGFTHLSPTAQMMIVMGLAGTFGGMMSGHPGMGMAGAGLAMAGGMYGDKLQGMMPQGMQRALQPSGPQPGAVPVQPPAGQTAYQMPEPLPGLNMLGANNGVAA